MLLILPQARRRNRFPPSRPLLLLCLGMRKILEDGLGHPSSISIHHPTQYIYTCHTPLIPLLYSQTNTNTVDARRCCGCCLLLPKSSISPPLQALQASSLVTPAAAPPTTITATHHPGRFPNTHKHTHLILFLPSEENNNNNNNHVHYHRYQRCSLTWLWRG